MARKQRIVKDESAVQVQEPEAQQAENLDEEFLATLQDGVSEEAKVEELPPRKVGRPKTIDKPVDDEKILKVHRELAEQCAMIAGTSCGVIGFITKHDHWKLDEEDAEYLGKAIASAIPSMPRKDAEKLLKKIPVVNLIIAGGAIFGTRIAKEVQIQTETRNLRIQQRQNPFRNAPQQQQPQQQPVNEQSPSENGRLIHFEIPNKDN